MIPKYLFQFVLLIVTSISLILKIEITDKIGLNDIAKAAHEWSEAGRRSFE
ncbi:hypothetical protein RsS62_15470 [Rhizobium dioscoreae]|nr:hypothetical protein RsS62_15470 [Rhizobium dioscoreae]